jgi:hypothetical protein
MNIDIPDATYDWRGLSILQPAASLIADGYKRVENRKRGQFKHDTWAGRWILIHASVSKTETKESIDGYPMGILPKYKNPSTLPMGCVVAIAHIKGIYDKNELDDAEKPWAHEGDGCMLFDVMIKLETPVYITGDLSMWYLKMNPTWSPPKKQSKKESKMNELELQLWRIKQEQKYTTKKFNRYAGLFQVLISVAEDRIEIHYHVAMNLT